MVHQLDSSAEPLCSSAAHRSSPHGRLPCCNACQGQAAVLHFAMSRHSRLFPIIAMLNVGTLALGFPFYGPPPSDMAVILPGPGYTGQSYDCWACQDQESP